MAGPSSPTASNSAGPKIGEGITQKEGMERPVYYWDPVIAPSGMIVYDGSMFFDQQGNIFVGGMASTKLVRLQMQDGKVVGEEKLLQDRGRRIRDVETSHRMARSTSSPKQLMVSCCGLRPPPPPPPPPPPQG